MGNTLHGLVVKTHVLVKNKMIMHRVVEIKEAFIFNKNRNETDNLHVSNTSKLKCTKELILKHSHVMTATRETTLFHFL